MLKNSPPFSCEVEVTAAVYSMRYKPETDVTYRHRIESTDTKAAGITIALE